MYLNINTRREIVARARSLIDARRRCLRFYLYLFSLVLLSSKLQNISFVIRSFPREREREKKKRERERTRKNLYITQHSDSL